MGGSTAGGYPYVTPTDNPKAFPAASQALANKLESTTGGKKMQSGTVVVTPNGTGQVSVTYPVVFAAKPVPVLSVDTSGGVLATARPNDTACTAATLVALLYNAAGAALTTGSYRIYWIAVGA